MRRPRAVAAEAAKPKRSCTMPAVTIVAPLEVPADLAWGQRKRSDYRAHLERLLDAPKGSVLKVGRLGARASVSNAAKALGQRVEFAIEGTVLYVRIVPASTCATVRRDAVLRALAASKPVAGIATVGALAKALDLTALVVMTAVRELAEQQKVDWEGDGANVTVRMRGVK